MSYILDALRRAEAERERGQLPGLHSAVALPQLTARRGFGRIGPDWPLPGGLVTPGVVAGAVAVAVVVAVGAWIWPQRSVDVAEPAPVLRAAAPAEAAEPAKSAKSAKSTIPTAAPAAASVVVTVPPAVKPTLTPAPTAVRIAPGLVAPGPAEARPPQPASAVVAAPTATGGNSAAAAPVPASAAMAPPVAALAPPIDGRIHAVDDLPAEVRRELPKLDFGGLVQLDNPPRRSLIVNGAILMEGELVQPNLVLEQIRLNGAVLRYKGWRYQLPL